jgi:hypothetical protein
MAPVSVVQPVGLLAFPWSILLAARAARTGVPQAGAAGGGRHRRATLAFTVVTSVHAVRAVRPRHQAASSSAPWWSTRRHLFALLGSKGPGAWRSLFWSSGGALFYGLEASW